MSESKRPIKKGSQPHLSVHVQVSFARSMAYLSDVDLATLHKSRLEERVQYRLSSVWTRDTEPTREQSSLVASSTPTASSVMFGGREAAKLKATGSSTNNWMPHVATRGTNESDFRHPRTSDIVNNNVPEQTFSASSSSIARGGSSGLKSIAMDRPIHPLQHQQQQYNFNGHVIRPRIRSSNSMSSSSSTASSYHHQDRKSVV